MGEPLGPQALGTRRIYPFRLLDSEDQEVLDTFLDIDPLAATLWAGDDQMPLAAPLAEWVDAASGDFRVTVAPEDLDGLAPGTYRLRVVIGPNVQDLLALDASIEITGAPGDAAALAVYGTENDLRQIARGWLGQLQTTDDIAGFAEQRAGARAWLDGIILARYQPSRGTRGAGLGAELGSPGVSTWLKGLLDADRLILTPAIVEACARHAVYLIGDGAIGAADQDAFQQFAWRQRWQADQIALALRVEIDTNADGVGDLVVDLGSAALS